MSSFVFMLKRYLKVTWPILCSTVINYFIPITDLFMIAHLGIIPVAAVSISIDLFVVLSTFPIGLAYGLTPFILQTNDKNASYENSQWLRNSLLINGFLSVFFGVLLYYSMHWLSYLGQDKKAVEMVVYYLPCLALSLIPTMIYNTFSRYLEGIGRTKPLLIVNLVGFLCNVVLNYLLIFGPVRFFSNGLIGAGLATLLSKIFMAIMLFPYVRETLFVRVKDALQASIFDVQRIKKLLVLGAPIGVQLLLEFAFFSTMGLMVGGLGALHKGANALLDNIISLPIGITWALSLAASTVVGDGNQKDSSQKRCSILVYYGTAGIVATLCACCIVCATSFLFMGIYKGSLEGYVLIHSSVFLAALFILTDAFYTIGLGLLRGLKDTFFPFMIATLSNWLVGIPMCYLLIYRLRCGIEAIWLSKIIAFFLTGSILFFRCLKKNNERGFLC
jgi:MATE family multidrug resistance protein